MTCSPLYLDKINLLASVLVPCSDTRFLGEFPSNEIEVCVCGPGYFRMLL